MSKLLLWQAQMLHLLEIDLKTEKDIPNLEVFLSEYFNDLINHDFEKFIHILYRLDINEQKIKKLLAGSPPNSGNIIAKMVIERQLEKEITKRNYKMDNSIPEDEKW